MDLFVSFLIAIGILIVINAASRWRANARRARAAHLPPGDAVVRRADRVQTRIFVDKTMPSGPKAGGISRDPATLLLGTHHLVLSTGHGRILEIGPDRPGEARCVGPKRLVIEGAHPSGRAQLRVELLLDDAEGWAAAITALSTD